MSATRLIIQRRYRERPAVIASLADFGWYADSEVDAARLLADARASLYCLDHAREWAIFASLPAGVDLTAAPFMYQAQFDRAECLYALPYADFLRLADAIPAPAGRLVFLHNIGRCGSTLLCRALNEIDGVMALSEPEAITNFISPSALPRDQRAALLRAGVAWLCRPAIRGDATHAALKLRNQAVAVMDLCVEAAPNAIHLFMYRQVIAWLASFYRFWVQRGDAPIRYPRAEIIAQQADYFQCEPAVFQAMLPPTDETFHRLEGRALGWVYALERYLELADRGAEVAGIRYEDLRRDRSALLGWLLARMGLPGSAAVMAERAFASDSQAGTAFARAGGHGNTIALPAEMRATVKRILAGLGWSADRVLPGTVGRR